jgi:hypothetical protein
LLLTQDKNPACGHSGITDVTATNSKEKTDYTNLALLMVGIYEMVQQDYLMQVKLMKKSVCNFTVSRMKN